MKNVIKIKPLSDVETIAVLKLRNFNGLKPVKCEDCGHSTDFTRNVFRIYGIKEDESYDYEIYGMISTHIRKIYGIDRVFFKLPNSKFYADSACCPKCQSTKIIFDI